MTTSHSPIHMTMQGDSPLHGSSWGQVSRSHSDRGDRTGNLPVTRPLALPPEPTSPKNKSTIASTSLRYLDLPLEHACTPSLFPGPSIPGTSLYPLSISRSMYTRNQPVPPLCFQVHVYHETGAASGRPAEAESGVGAQRRADGSCLPALTAPSPLPVSYIFISSAATSRGVRREAAGDRESM